MKTKVSAPCYNSPPPPHFLVMIQINPVYALANDFVKIPFILYFHLHLGLPSCHFPPSFLIKSIDVLAICLLYLRTTFLIHLINPYIIISIIFGEEYIS
jgi:hypothetical protein